MYKKLKEQLSVNEQKRLIEQENKKSPEQERIERLLEGIKEAVRGGLSDTHTPETIAKKHGVSVKEIEAQIEIGKKIEMEHTNDSEEARRVAMDHLVELPDYYTRLVKMEKDAEKELKEAYKLYEEILAEENLPEDPQYAVPEEKQFPLFDKIHLLFAIKSFPLINPFYHEKAAKRIIKKMKFYNMRKSNVSQDSKLYKYVKDSNLPE